DFFNTPRHSGSLWTSYKVTPKFTAGVGMYAQSDAVGSYTKSGDAVLIKASLAMRVLMRCCLTKSAKMPKHS
ncbi:MAG TPA: hypothetical protein PK856_07045, partial [Vitreoscilla sp.]|nr:hypothetical protein [Vitreoscilla sp.]